MQLSSDTEIDW